VLLGWDAARQQFIHQLRGVGIRTLVLVIVEALPGDVVTPGPGQEPAEGVHRLEMGKIAEGLARL
jgi:hypothetical protein